MTNTPGPVLEAAAGPRPKPHTPWHHYALAALAWIPILAIGYGAGRCWRWW